MARLDRWSSSTDVLAVETEPGLQVCKAPALCCAGATFWMKRMKKYFLLILFVFLSVLPASADLSDEAHKTEIAAESLKDSVFVVTADENTSSDSLNRISGHYDLGFAGPSQVYQSDHHYKPGPFARAAAEESTQKRDY